MFENYSKVFKKVLDYSKVIYLNSNKDCEEDLDYDDITDLFNTDEERTLIDYLERLDYEIIKILLVIMYIGSGIPDVYEEYKNEQELYESVRASFDKDGWNTDKSIEIYQMTTKAPLYKYLKKGFELLNIRLN